MLKIGFTNKFLFGFQIKNKYSDFIKLSTCLINHFISNKLPKCRHEKKDLRLLFLHEFKLGNNAT